MVFDEHDSGLPAAFGILEREETEDLEQFLTAVIQAAQKRCPGWKPSCIMTDCARNERSAIASIFPDIPILLCIYHVRKAWTQKLMECVRDHGTRIAMNKALEDLCYGSNLFIDESVGDSYETCARMKLAVFKDRFCTEPAFVQYFEKEWEPCMGKTFCFIFNIVHTVILIYE